MTNRVEKLCLLSEMIALSRAGKTLKPIEYKFLLSVAKQLEITREDFDYLIKTPVNYTNLQSHSERIVQFHRFVMLMDYDAQISHKELTVVHNFGLRMGLGQESINRVLDLMESFPNKMVPADFLIDIFKVQYN
ncbi:TerB family tellurite resistance protein [Lacinutrix undariae]